MMRPAAPAQMHRTFQVSVGPSGEITLPRTLRCEDVEDFIGAVSAAAELGAQVGADHPVDVVPTVIPPVVTRPITGPAASPRTF